VKRWGADAVSFLRPPLGVFLGWCLITVSPGFPHTLMPQSGQVYLMRVGLLSRSSTSIGAGFSETLRGIVAGSGWREGERPCISLVGMRGMSLSYQEILYAEVM